MIAALVLAIMYSAVNWWFFHVVRFPAVLLNTSTGEIESEFHVCSASGTSNSLWILHGTDRA